MPNPKPVEALEVIQADREAAANVIDRINCDTQTAKSVREGFRDDQWILQAFARHRIEHSPTPARNEVLAEAARGLLDRASDTYRKRNGHISTIQADDGEKCWIVHSDDIEDLRRALTPAPEPTNPAGVTECSLGTMHGYASAFVNAEGVVCCDFCGQPVDDDPPPNPAGVSGVAEELEQAALEIDCNRAYGEVRHINLMRRAAQVIRTPAPDAGLREALESIAAFPDHFPTLALANYNLGLAVREARATLARVRQGKGGNDATG